MKIVIDIPKKMYNEIKERTIVTCGETFAKNLVRRIRNGTPLPEHYGSLIECEPIYDKLIQSYRADENDYPEAEYAGKSFDGWYIEDDPPVLFDPDTLITDDITFISVTRHPTSY